MDDKKFKIDMTTAVALESMGRLKEAEKVILEVIAKCDSRKKGLAGTLYLDLGDIAEQDKRIDDSISYYKKATQLLSGMKGELILQLAHAHFNLARIYLWEFNSENCLSECAHALELYLKYPFTSSVDLADAKILNAVSKAVMKNQFDYKEFEIIWGEISKLKYSDLNQRNIAMFFYFYISYAKIMNKPLKNFLKQAKKWAGRSAIKFVKKNVECNLKK